MAQSHCPNCGNCIGCSCQGCSAMTVASDGKKVCTKCKDAYEKSLIANAKVNETQS